MKTMPRAILLAVMAVAELMVIGADTERPSANSSQSVRSERKDALRNAGFESGNEGWAVDGRMWRILPGEGRGDSAALVYENADTNVYSFPFQRVVVEGGGVYRFGAWVKVDRLEYCGKPAKASVYFDWNDKTGNCLGTAWGRVVVHNLSNTDGWEYYEGQTPVMPSAAVFGKIAAVVPKGRIGKVRVDDFTFSPLGVKAVEFIASSRYRDEGWEGVVDFHVLQHVNTIKHPLSEVSAQFVYTGPDGGEWRLKPTVFTADEAGVSIPVHDLAKGAHPVRYVLSAVGTGVLGEAECRFTRLEGDPKRHCYLDEHRRFIIGGKRFFPLGLYYYNASFDVGSADFRRYLSGPFNTILPYSSLTPEKVAAIGRTGLKVIYPVTGLVRGSAGENRGCSTKEGADRMLADRVNSLKDQPSLIAWYDIDEAPAKQVEPLMEARDTIHREDPDHPVWGVTDKPGDLRMFTRAMDIAGVDPYPIGNNPDRADIGLCADWALAARSNMWNAVAVWHVPQAFNWRNDRPNVPNPDHRFPTREEFANMCYQLIAAGANGLIPFSYSGAVSEKHDRSSGWQRVCEVFAELRGRTELFLSDPGPAAVKVPKGVVARTWRTEEDDVKVLVVNKTRRPARGVVRLADGSSIAVDLPALGYSVATARKETGR